MLIVAFMMFGIGISRFMLGAHSIDQVVYGWSYGLWFAFFFFKYVRPRVQIHLSHLLESNQDHLSIHDQAALKGKSLKYLMIALVAWVALILIFGAIYFFFTHKFQYPDFWI